MAAFFVQILEDKFSLTPQDTQLLLRTLRSQNRADRRYYYQKLKPRESEFIPFLRQYYHNLNEEEQNKWWQALLDNMLSLGGEADISDAMLMKILGPLNVYNKLREKAEKEGVKLKMLVNFGGMGAVIMLVGVVTGLVLFLLNR